MTVNIEALELLKASVLKRKEIEVIVPYGAKWICQDYDGWWGFSSLEPRATHDFVWNSPFVSIIPCIQQEKNPYWHLTLCPVKPGQKLYFEVGE